MTGRSDVGFNGTYRATYTVVAATGTAVAELGDRTSATLTVRTVCPPSGSCSTVIAINGHSQKPETPAGAGTWSDTFDRSEICRDFRTGELTGGSYPYRVQTVYHAVAPEASVTTDVSGTQTYTQLRKCPRQTDALYSRTVSITMTRTGR